jgi:cysteine desulfurase
VTKTQYIYLDHAAATPIDEEVVKVMGPYFTQDFYNPSATYLPAIKIKQVLEEARTKVAFWLGAKPSEIIFTAGASEANNLAIQGIMKRYPEGNLVYSAIEHESVIEPSRQFNSKQIKVKSDGRIDMDDLKQKIDDKTVLVSVMQANNEIGTVEPLHDIARLIGQIKDLRRQAKNSLPLFFHTDATQAANYLDLHANRLGVDLMSLNGGKIYGPKQTGVLYVKSGIDLEPLIYGGGQERGLRSGTENVAGFYGLATALDIAQTSRHEESERLSVLQANFIDLLQKASPDIQINGSIKYRLPNNVHIILPGKDNERLLLELEEKGILAAAGSACSASNEESSHVLKAIGKTDDEARSSLRLTMGRATSIEYIEKTVQAITSLT